MSLKDTDVKTPGNKAIAKKWKLSSSEVNKLVKQGANHEKEHNTNIEKAKQVARDHIGERPDYYKMLDKADKMDKNKLDEFKTDNFPSSNSIEDRRSPERKADDSKLSPGKDIGDANGPSYSIMKSPQDWGNSTDKPDFGYDSGAQNLRAPRQKEPFTNDQDKVSPTLKQDKSYWPEPVKAIKNKPELSLNELSNKLMKKYMKRAKGELNARDYVTRSGGDYVKKPDLFQTGPASPHDKEVTDQYPKIHKRQRGMERATALMNIREVKTYGRVSRPGWKPSKDSTTPASPGEPKGDAMKNAFDRIEKAFPKGSIKVGGRKPVNEGDIELGPIHGTSLQRMDSNNRAKSRDEPKQAGDTTMLWQGSYSPKQQSSERITDTQNNDGSSTIRSVKKFQSVNEIANTPKGQSTLVKYVRGAAKDLYNTGVVRGHDVASNPRPNGGDTELRKMTSRVSKNRQTGIERAVKRMNPGLKETTMDKQDMVAEAINNILEGNLENMRQNLYDVLQETAIEKLEERKKEIASNYFAQD